MAKTVPAGVKAFQTSVSRLPLKIKARAALPHPVVHAILDLLFILLIRQIIQNLLVQSSGDEEFSRHPKLRMNSASRTNMKPLMVNSDTGTLARYSSVKSDDGRVSISSSRNPQFFISTIIKLNNPDSDFSASSRYEPLHHSVG